MERIIEKKKKKREVLLLLLVLQELCELIRDSLLWHSNCIPLVHDSIIIIGSRSIIYTFGLRFNYKRWVKVSIKI